MELADAVLCGIIRFTLREKRGAATEGPHAVVGKGRGSERADFFAHQLPLGIVGAARVEHRGVPQRSGLAQQHALVERVDRAHLNFGHPIRQERGASNAPGVVIRIEQMTLPAAAFLGNGPIGVVPRNLFRPARGGDRGGEAIFTVCEGSDAPQGVGLLNNTPLQIVAHTRTACESPDVLRRFQRMTGGVPLVLGDGFRGDANIAIVHGAARGFNKLPRTVIRVGGHHAIGIHPTKRLTLAGKHLGLTPPIVPARGYAAIEHIVLHGGAIGELPMIFRCQHIAFLAYGVALLRDVAHAPRALPDNEFAFFIPHLSRNAVEGVVLSCRCSVAVMSLRAVSRLLHLDPSGGKFPRCISQPRFFHGEQSVSFAPRTLLNAFDVILLRIGVFLRQRNAHLSGFIVRVLRPDRLRAVNVLVAAILRVVILHVGLPPW